MSSRDHTYGRSDVPWAREDGDGSFVRLPPRCVIQHQGVLNKFLLISTVNEKWREVSKINIARSHNPEFHEPDARSFPFVCLMTCIVVRGLYKS